MTTTLRARSCLHDRWLCLPGVGTISNTSHDMLNYSFELKSYSYIKRNLKQSVQMTVSGHIRRNDQ